MAQIKYFVAMIENVELTVLQWLFDVTCIDIYIYHDLM